MESTHHQYHPLFNNKGPNLKERSDAQNMQLGTEGQVLLIG